MKKSLPESSIFEQKIKNFRPRCWNAEFRGLGEDLGLDFGRLGKVLGSSWAILRASSDDLGAFGRRPWGFVPAMLRVTWTLVGRFWPKLNGLENYVRKTVGGGLIIL